MVQSDYSMIENMDNQAGGPRGASGGAVPRGPGLSTAHNPPQSSIKCEPAVLKVWQGAGLIEVKHEKYQIPCKVRGDRGKISQFSRQSRKRLLNLLGTIDRTEKPLFVTLTYPSEFVAAAEHWKNDLEKFYKRISRKWEKVSFIWKLEPQKRGAPHYHLLLWGVEYYEFRRWISSAWYEVVGSGDIKHLYAGTQVEKMKDWTGVMSYASKYLGKIFNTPVMVESGWDSPGRFWGIKGRQHLPAVIADEIKGLTEKQVHDLFRLMRRYAGIKARNYRSLSILVKNPTQWVRTLRE